MPDDGGYAALWEWRRRIAAIYAEARGAPDGEQAWRIWRAGRDALYRSHPQSPLDPADRAGFTGLPFFPYDPALRFIVGLDPVDGPPILAPAGDDGEVRLRPFAETRGLAEACGRELTLYWIQGYGGGVFLPFKDATGGVQTYGGGRYLLDTVKGADLGIAADGRTVVDFNFAYNPSCSYSARYLCPLAPAANNLAVPVRAGEMRPAG